MADRILITGGAGYTGVLAIFLGRLLSGRGLVVYAGGLQTRDFVSVHDVVAAFAAAIASDLVSNHVLAELRSRGLIR